MENNDKLRVEPVRGKFLTVSSRIPSPPKRSGCAMIVATTKRKQPLTPKSINNYCI